MVNNSGFTRRKFIQLAGLSTLGAGLLNFESGALSTSEAQAGPSTSIADGDQALKKLMEGNKRYVQALKSGHPRRTEERRIEMPRGAKSLRRNPCMCRFSCGSRGYL